MATTTTPTPTPIAGLNAQDQAFMDGFYDTIKDSAAALTLYNGWGTILSKKPTHDGKLAYIRDIINNTNLAPKYRAKLPELGVKWLADSNPGVVDSKGDAFSTDFYKGIISGDAKTRTANSTALNTAKTKIATESVKLANPKATPAEVDAMVADIVNGSTTKPYTPAGITKAITTSPSADLYKPGSMTAAELKTKYGAITDPDTGEPLFSDDYFAKLAAATTPLGVQGFNDTLSKVASKVLTSQKGSNYLVQSDADKAKALSDLLKNPDKIASGATALFTSTQTKGIDGLLPVGTFKDANGNFVYNGGEIQPEDMSAFVQKFATQDKGEYHAPVFDEVSQTYKASPLGKATSPYTNTLYSLLGSAKNPFASDYKSSLESRQPAEMTSTQLASLNKPFKDNPTAKDLLNLQNSAGMRKGNELTKGSSLSPNLIDLYQTNPDGSAINSPWVADTDQMKIPTTTKPDIDTSTELVQLDPGGLLRDNTVVDPNLAANQATAAGIDTLTGKSTVAGNAGIDTLSGSTVGGPAVNPRTGKPNYTVRNPTGFTANDLQLMQAMGWTPEQLKANNEQLAIEQSNKQSREADAAASTNRISNIIDSWKSPEDRWKWFAENPTDPYTLMTKEDIKKGVKLPANYMTPPVVTDKPIVTGNDSIKAVTGNDSIKSVTGNDSIKAVTGNDSILAPQVTLTKQLTPEEIAAQKAALVETPFNAGIVTPSINKVVSKENLNTDVKGTNGESGVVPLLYADMAKNTGRVPTPMVQGWGGTPIPETSMTNTGTPVLLDNQSYTITSNPNTPAGITSLVGPQQPAVAPGYQNTIPQLGLDQYRIIYGGAPTTPEQEATARSLAQ